MYLRRRIIEEGLQEIKINSQTLKDIELIEAKMRESIIQGGIVITGAIINETNLISGNKNEGIISNAVLEGGTIIEGSIEGGRYLDILLFGEPIDHITEPAVKFLFSENVIKDLSAFQKEFKKLNASWLGVVTDYFLRGRNVQLIGECLSRFLYHYKK